MSLCHEAAAFLGLPRVTLPATRSVRLLTGKESDEERADDIPHSVKTNEPANEDTMPKTATPDRPKRKYTRRNPTVTLPELAAAAAPDPKARKTRQEKLSGVIFSVDSTGALLIRRGDHGMEFSASEVGQLVEFLERAEDMLKPQIERGAIV